VWFHPSQTLWTQEEREALQKYIASTNPKKRKNWIECAKAVKTKDVRQCFDFYTDVLYYSIVFEITLQ
jgi:hypothetical protein